MCEKMKKSLIILTSILITTSVILIYFLSWLDSTTFELEMVLPFSLILIALLSLIFLIPFFLLREQIEHLHENKPEELNQNFKLVQRIEDNLTYFLKGKLNY